MEQQRSHVDRDGLESSRRFESRVLPVTRSIGELSDQRSFRATRYSVFGDRSVEGTQLLRDRGLRDRRQQALMRSHERDDFGACSSARLERPPDKREVGGSNPPRPTTFEDAGSSGANGVREGWQQGRQSSRR